MNRSETNKPGAARSRITDERACVGCGYSLKGLWTDGRCPECGRPIVPSRRDIPRFSDSMVNAPAAWLGRLRFGSSVLLVSLVSAMVLLALAGLLESWAMAVGAAGACGAWWLGAFLVTQPRPVMQSTTVPPRTEWQAFRWWGRGTQVAWGAMCIPLGMWVEAARTGGGASAPMIAAVLACFSVGAIGLIPLLLYLSNLAFWASDTGLAGHLRGCACAIGAGAALVVLTVLHGLSGARLFGGVLGTMVLLMAYFLTVAPVAYLVFCLWCVRGLSVWAMRGHNAVQARDQRLRQRVQREAAKATSRAGGGRIDAAGKGKGLDQAGESGVTGSKVDGLNPYELESS